MDRTNYVALVVMGMLAGCSSAFGSEGELGNGRFGYDCAGESDHVCDEDPYLASDEWNDNDHVMPTSVAVDAPFKVIYLNADGANASLNMQAASAVMVEQSGSAFRAIQPGVFALLAYSYANRIEDYVHLEAKEIADIHVLRDSVSSNSTIAARVGEPISLRTIPVAADGTELAGALDCRWSAADETVVELEGSRNDNSITLVPARVGSTWVSVRFLDHRKGLFVTVEGVGP